MSVLKIYDMSSVDEVKKTEAESRQLRENKKYSQYSENDIVLIRTTENFPTGRVIRPLSEIPILNKTIGNFDDKGYIIIDPLSEHVSVDDIRCFAGQDTFIKGAVALSDRAIIIIKSENYEIISEAHPEIEEFNVVLYNGIPNDIKQNYIEESNDDFAEIDTNDERAIVERVLMDLGYIPEIISSNYIINSPTSNKIVEVNERLGQRYK